MHVTVTAAQQDPFSEPLLVRWLKALWALARLLRNPGDTRQVFEISDRLNVAAHRRIAGEFEKSADGAALLEQQPSIGHPTVVQCRSLPVETLGRAYAAFIDAQGLSSELFQPPKLGMQAPFKYVKQRLRQTHDLWHVLTSCGTDVGGEIELQAFTFGQTGLPTSALIAVGGLLRFGLCRPSLWRRTLRAYFKGKRTPRLATVRWEQLWNIPLSTLRAELLKDDRSR
jgi:ubiquinone biosynthesis protein COQ4